MARIVSRILQPFPRGDRAAAALLVVTALMVGYGTVMVGSASDAQSASMAARPSPWPSVISSISLSVPWCSGWWRGSDFPG